MAVPTVNVGDELLASDVNTHIAQTNTNTGNITSQGSTITSQGSTIATHTSQISTINSNISGLNNAATDTHITSDNSGNMTVVGLTAPSGINFNIGRIKDINSGNFSGSGTVNHGLSGSPANVLLCPSVNGATFAVSAFGFTSTQFGATLSSASNTDFFAYR